ncbi:hypothetical protein BOTBODRAFT_536674 [Botryobasidium botryosum FD-172 SS1]|uniref:Uncharacterized protein n=1 Tax=Botryobasidium botryosum (strain FD-172 SS1) TaxID=930990 RepID=A0A067M344_BOTB1|nr:hypothetical protein BOTBODRAFT_536674 [Botryobasidium botryosum FD-172 SS1]
MTRVEGDPSTSDRETLDHSARKASFKSIYLLYTLHHSFAPGPVSACHNPGPHLRHELPNRAKKSGVGVHYWARGRGSWAMFLIISIVKNTIGNRVPDLSGFPLGRTHRLIMYRLGYGAGATLGPLIFHGSRFSESSCEYILQTMSTPPPHSPPRDGTKFDTTYHYLLDEAHADTERLLIGTKGFVAPRKKHSPLENRDLAQRRGRLAVASTWPFFVNVSGLHYLSWVGLVSRN